jgi:periplasmic protein TonB
MLEVLFASRGVRTPRPVAGAIVSAAMHGVVLMALVVNASRSARERLEFLQHQLDQSKILPMFLVPPNRGAPPMVEQIQYMAMGAGNAADGIAASKKKFDKKGDLGLAQIKGAEAPPQVAIPAIAESTVPDNAFSVLDVDSAAVRDPSSAAPAYPPLMREKGIEGYATLRFVIDSTGLIDMATVTLVDASHAEFVQAVRDAMPKMRFRPAMMGLQAVRQLAEQPFKFEIKALASSETRPPTPITAARKRPHLL